SVVSASSEPDTIKMSTNIESNSLSKRRHIIAIQSKVIGKKKTLIRLLENGGTVEEEVIDNYNCCISDEDLLRLVNIGLQIHKHYGNARDIEWGLKGGQIFMLQSRPVTNLDNSYTDYEIMHELDSSHPSEFEIYSRAHWGETFPGASSWICMQWFWANKPYFFRQDILNGTATDEDYNPFAEVMGIQYNQVMFDLQGGIFKMFAGYPDSKRAETAVLAKFGHHIDDKDVLQLFRRQGLEAKKPSLMGYVRLFRFVIHSLLFGPKNLIKTKEEIIEKNGYDLVDILKQESNNNNNDVEDDYNLMVSSATDVISAEVPKILAEIAKSIRDKQWFSQLSDEEALQVLQTGTDESSQKFRYFIERHGHRGYRELDPMYKPWKGNPMPCIKIIKTLLLSGNESQFGAKSEKSVDKVINELKTPLSPLKKLLIKYLLLPWTRRGIGYRELSKYLAQEMTKEGLIPSVDTFFYLTITEVEALCNGQRDPLIFSRVRQRRRLYPRMDKYKFEEFIKGPEMKPRNNCEDQHFITDEYISSNPNSFVRRLTSLPSPPKRPKI
ncbi:unnamed protein product, partial [Medioppia subpectinata]